MCQYDHPTVALFGAPKRPRNHPLSLVERFAEIHGVDVRTVRTMATSNRVVDILNSDFGDNFGIANRPTMCVKNFAEESVFNGDIGPLHWISKHYVDIDFPVGRVRLPLSSTKPAWATTVHKAQGREADIVVVFVESCASRRALYTAITRAKKRCALVGSLKNMATAINREEKPRFSLFKAFLSGEANLLTEV